MWRIARPVLVAYLLVVLAMTFLETWLVYPAPPVAWGDWQPDGLDQEDIWFQSADCTKLFGWFVPHPSPKRAILYCHGNGEHVGLNGELAARLRDELAATVFLFDYRGYGHSEGRPSEAGCIADGQAARTWLANRLGIAPSEVVLMGRSLGSGVVVALAADGGAPAIVLENAFTSLVDVAAHHYPWLPVRLLMRNRYDCLTRIEHYQGPLLQSHGTDDEIVPIDLARRLFDAAPGRMKRFIELPGLGHNDWPPLDYHRDVAAFLDHVEADR